MQIIDYQPINLSGGRLCKVYHSDLILEESKAEIEAAIAAGLLKEFPKPGKTPPTRPHWHNYYEFNCVAEGQLECTIGDTTEIVSDRDFAFANAGVVHQSRELSSPYLGFAVLVPADPIQELYQPSHPGEKITIQASKVHEYKEEIWPYLEAINQISRQEGPSSVIKMNACVLAIFGILIDHCSRIPEDEAGNISGHNHNDSDGNDFMDYISQHYKEPITLRDTADAFGFNSAYFSRLFQKKTGLNFHAYLTSLRISHASYLLKNTRMPISDISVESGFPSIRSFNDQFIKINGIAPKQYRDQSKA